MAPVDSPLSEYAAIKWWQKIDLGNGVVTPGPDITVEKLAALSLPQRMDGADVIDIGAWDGFFSFECEKRGANKIVATDHFCWQSGGDAGFRYAKAALRSKVEQAFVKVEDLSPETLGTFDIVLFLGVLYHAENMMLYLRKVRAMCRQLAIVETVIDGNESDTPVATFLPGATMNNDPTNFWSPNIACVKAMLREVGFRKVEMVNRWLPYRAVFHATL